MVLIKFFRIRKLEKRIAIPEPSSENIWLSFDHPSSQYSNHAMALSMARDV